jgi:membrane-associated protease RseP (regulator of RpoE activity)
VDQRDTPERDDDVRPAQGTVGGWLAQHALSLVVVAAVVAFICIKLDPVTVGLVTVGLGLVIFIHELGHFAAAKWCDVHVETFSIGFGPPLPGCRFQKGETTYQIALVPLGGYVKMVGEGNEEEGEDDPRSFKNKSVRQRMLIISAGVVMNLLLAAACFVGVYMTTGVERAAGVIGTVDAGSPAWQKGLKPGVQLLRIGASEKPLFDDVMPEVMHWKPGLPIPVKYESFFNGKTTVVETEVVPRINKDRGRPMIGIGPAWAATLLPKSRRNIPPYAPESAAARAEPPLQNGDRIVGATDPNQPADGYNPNRTTPLDEDPRATGTDRRDYFDLARRMMQLAGREIVLLVRHEHPADASTADDSAPVAVHIPATFKTSYGLRLGMGPITAVREGSAAEKERIQIRTAQETGDTIFEVGVADSAGVIQRYVSDPGPNPPKGVEALDPYRLPDQLRQWAALRGEGPKTVKLKLKRKAGHNEQGQDVMVELPWDDGWQDQPSAPSSEGSPRAIDGLGLAYAVKTQIDFVQSDTPAAKAVVTTHSSTTVTPLLTWLVALLTVGLAVLFARQQIQTLRTLPTVADLSPEDRGRLRRQAWLGLTGCVILLAAVAVAGIWYLPGREVGGAKPGVVAQAPQAVGEGPVANGSVYPLHKGDVIKAVRFFKNTDGKITQDTEIELGPDQGAHALWLADEIATVRRLGLVIQRGENEKVEVVMDGIEDTSRPHVERGIRFDQDMRLEKADTPGQAVVIGLHHTWRLITRIYQNLAAMFTGRISFSKNASGPLDIAAVSYAIADQSFPLFVLFIGMISVNLAVINFLPIPILDGGHMVFLIYEGVRGRPAPEAIRVAATFIGLAMIGSLMAFVLFLDVQKRL